MNEIISGFESILGENEVAVKELKSIFNTNTNTNTNTNNWYFISYNIINFIINTKTIYF